MNFYYPPASFELNPTDKNVMHAFMDAEMQKITKEFDDWILEAICKATGGIVPTEETMKKYAKVLFYSPSYICKMTWGGVVIAEWYPPEFKQNKNGNWVFTQKRRIFAF